MHLLYLIPIILYQFVILYLMQLRLEDVYCTIRIELLIVYVILC